MTTNKVTDIHPLHRDLRFDFDFSRLKDWNSGGKNYSHFMNSLSIFFPKGEQFFIDSVNNYRNHPSIKNNPALLKDIRHFIGQEAMHGREHQAYNQAIEDQGMGSVSKEKFVDGLLKVVNATFPKSLRLSATCALEHLTATMADGLLRHGEDISTNSDKTFVAAWRWHALEETEHKGVAYDVFQAAVGDDKKITAYTARLTGHVLANMIFWPIAVAYWLDISRRAGDLGNRDDWQKTLSGLFGKKHGLLRKQLPMWASYFQRGFHPWQHDNRQFLEEIDAITALYAKAA